MVQVVLRDAVGEPMSHDEVHIWLKDHVEWCCPGRHGVVRNLDESETNAARYAISYVFGAYDGDGLWWKNDGDGKWSCEFVHMCKVSPPPEKPWEWCGKTVLFKDWRLTLQLSEEINRMFPHGTCVVVYDYEDVLSVGQVSHITPKYLHVEDFGGMYFKVPKDMGKQHDGSTRYSIAYLFPDNDPDAYDRASHGA